MLTLLWKYWVIYDDTTNVLTFVIYHSPYSKPLRDSLFNLKDTFKKLIGDRRIIVAERRGVNMSDILFCKSSFSQMTLEPKNTQKCGTKNCKTCPTMNIPKNITLNDFNIKLDFRQNCKSEKVIYVAQCKNCSEFYIGQTQNELRVRCNGHRKNFNLQLYNKSALSMHLYKDHLERFGNKLCDYNFGVIKQSRPLNLDREEDFYICNTKAILTLNRYKVVR